jgi:hypothetical protein
MMRLVTGAGLVLAMGVLAPVPSQAFDMNMMLLLTGPVSEAVQETVLLVRRGDHFISPDSLIIGCVAGASAGFAVSVAPLLGLTVSGAGTPVGIAYVAGVTLLSCGMAVMSGAAGMGTMWALREWQGAPETPLAAAAGSPASR